MCGIWGLLALSKRCRLSSQQLYKLFMSIKHRGPDRSTFIDNEFYQIGFHRLAIMDPSTQGDQPFAQSVFYENSLGHEMLRTIYVLCNGQIYNYTKLKRQIESKQNYIFKSHSDIEVLLPLFKDHGIHTMTEKLNGQFAFAIFDTVFNTVTKETEFNLYLGRDRFGIRPLFYTRQDQTFAFASEMKALVGIGEKIEQFPPRTWMHIRGTKDGQLQINSKQYYSAGLPKSFFGDMYENIRDEFREAVRIRLDSDRPIGCLLSGGLDSSLVAAVAAQCLRKQHRKLRTFSIGMPNSPDARYAQMVADHIGSVHTNVQIPQQEWLNKLDIIIKMCQTFDITTIRASTGLYLITKWISENTDIKVLLTGQGSDQLCGGYLYFHKAPNQQQFHKENVRLLNDLHFYDCLRADRGIAINGLEARVPFLDYNFVDLYLNLDKKTRMAQLQEVAGKVVPCQKWLLRKAFEPTKLLPTEVLWRKKQAFSDGVSSEQKSWYQIIQEEIQKKINDKELQEAQEIYKGFLVPHTKQALYYHQVFDQLYPHQFHITPYYWLPKWVGNAKDPSARTLEVYKEVEKAV